MSRRYTCAFATPRNLLERSTNTSSVQTKQIRMKSFKWLNTRSKKLPTTKTSTLKAKRYRNWSWKLAQCCACKNCFRSAPRFKYRTSRARDLRWFLRKKSSRWIFLKLSLNVLHQALFRKKTINMIGHHSHLRDMMGQSYPIFACSHANHAHYSLVHVKFCSSSKHTLFK